jgi:hypothetical protein
LITEAAEAIYQEYLKAPALKAVLPDGFYYEQAPQDTDGRYCVFFILGASTEEIMGGQDDRILYLSVQFNLFSNAADGGSKMADMVERLTRAYDWKVLQIDGFSQKNGHRRLATAEMLMPSSLYERHVWVKPDVPLFFWP